MTKLIPYIRTPQVCALEYDEQRDLEQHPDKADFYAKLIEQRTAWEQKQQRRKKRGKREDRMVRGNR